ncbi:hypothetical protein ABI59_14600 [Acidobacteria bacterium Mor1]|nr:hypothetical protein ABI59_14600 [Acidobacteria bacterium Mor1]
MAEDKSNRTEEPTSRRLQKAREDGRVPRSKDVSSTLTLVFFLVFAQIFGADWFMRLKNLAGWFFANAGSIALDPISVMPFLRMLMGKIALLVAPPVGVMMVAGVGGSFVQARPNLTFKPFKPDFSKLNPVKGIKKIFSMSKVVELLKTLAKLVAYSWVAWNATRSFLENPTAHLNGAEGALLGIFMLCAKVMLHVAVLAALLAIVDYLWTRYDYTKGLRMTKKEVKDERKELEGDPRVKGRIRQQQMAMSRTRMMADVATATVVVTNPTHYAVALRYVPGETEVPIVVAKGMSKLAARIREIATENNVPIISDPPLARALYKAVEVGSEVPFALYKAVAEILALVLKGKGRRRAPVRPNRGPEAGA